MRVGGWWGEDRGGIGGRSISCAVTRRGGRGSRSISCAVRERGEMGKFDDRVRSGHVRVSESSGGIRVRPVAFGEVQVETVGTENAGTIGTGIGVSGAK